MDVVLLIAVVLLLFDAQNIFALSGRRVLRGGGETSDDYTIVVPVYGHRRYFDQRDHLVAYRERVLVALDMAGHGMDDLADELEAEGWRVHRTRVPAPGPPSLILDALRSGLVTTTYAFRMDADTSPVDDPGPFVAEMARDGTDYASVNVRVGRPRRLVERIQALEYRMAMRGRRLRPWLSSGACYGGTTDALRRVLSHHSMWFPGEDLEAGRIALAMRLKVRHLDLRVDTEAPCTWRALARQRRSWWSGGFRHAVVNADKNIRHTPVWTFYNLGLVVVGAFLKVEEHVEVRSPARLAVGFLILFAVYAVVTAIANWPVRTWLMVAYPPYALVQALAMPVLGSVYWARHALSQRHWGRYRFGYRRGAGLRVITPPVGAGPAARGPLGPPSLARPGVALAVAAVAAVAVAIAPAGPVGGDAIRDVVARTASAGVERADARQSPPAVPAAAPAGAAATAAAAFLVPAATTPAPETPGGEPAPATAPGGRAPAPRAAAPEAPVPASDPAVPVGAAAGAPVPAAAAPAAEPGPAAPATPVGRPAPGKPTPATPEPTVPEAGPGDEAPAEPAEPAPGEGDGAAEPSPPGDGAPAGEEPPAAE